MQADKIRAAIKRFSKTHIALPAAKTHVTDRYHKSTLHDDCEQISDPEPFEAVNAVEWDFDAHFTYYTHPTCLRLDKSHNTCGIQFDLFAADLDFEQHSSRPTDVDFLQLLLFIKILEADKRSFSPNIVYTSRGGARFIYFIEPMINAERFENAYQNFLSQLATQVKKASIGYDVDLGTKDWTRLNRLALVTRENEDGTETKEWDHHIVVRKASQLDLAIFYKERKPRQRKAYTGKKRYTGFDPYLKKLINNMSPGDSQYGRNNTALRALTHILRKYHPTFHQKLIDLIHGYVVDGDFTEDEFEGILERAKGYAEIGD